MLVFVLRFDDTSRTAMKTEYDAKKAELDALALSKESVAAASGISMSTLTHDKNAMRLYNGFLLQNGIETDDPEAPNPEMEALRKKVAEQKALIMSLNHKLDSLEQLGLEMFAKDKVIEGLRSQLAMSKKSIELYYKQLKEIKDADAAWAGQINTLFRNQNTLAS